MASSSSSASLASTLQELLQNEANLIQQASEAVPHLFDACTYQLGHIRQAVYWCKTCAEPWGICSACSVACHGDHEQVELFPKRAFRCDCPTSTLSQRCKLYHRHAADDPLPPNDTNTYGHNYRGHFCRCGREYNPETEEETMIQCVSCEDWFHESCLHLRSTSPTSLPSDLEDAEAKNVSIHSDDDQIDDAHSEDSESDPALMLRPSQYDSVVCGACVRKSALLSRWAGSPGIRMIIKRRNQIRWALLGDDVIPGEEPQHEIDITSTGSCSINRAALLEDPSSPSASKPPRFHARQEEDAPDDTSRKKVRLESTSRSVTYSSSAEPSSSSSPSLPLCNAPNPSPNEDAQLALASSYSGPFFSNDIEADKSSSGIVSEGDIFLSEGWRDRWCRCGRCLPQLEVEQHLLEDSEVYEPPGDPDAQFSLEELGMRALDKLPRDKALDGIRAFNQMRDDLLAYLRPFAERRKVVSEKDIKAFFEENRAKLARF